MPDHARFHRTGVAILLAVILLSAAGLRFYNLNWDNGIFAHPDERSTVAFYAPTIRWPAAGTPLLDPRLSPLNPFWNVDAQERRSYTYGHFPLYTLVLLANFLNDLVPFVVALPFELPSEWVQFLATSTTAHSFAWLGRFLAGLSDLFTIYLLFLIGRRLYGAWGGLLAAAFSTFTVLQIQLAHFFAVDPISTTFTLLALYGSILLHDRQSTGAATITGIGIALAVASKFSALPVVFLPIVAGYLVIRKNNRTQKESTQLSIINYQLPITNYRSPVSRIIALIVLSLSLAFVIFALTSPFVLLDFENFKRAVLDEQGNMVSGVADFPFTRQYRNTTAYWYFIDQQLRWGMGWALGLVGLVGSVWVALKAIRGQAQVGELLALLWLVLYFGPTGLFLAKFMRYMSPVVPLINLFAAGFIAALWQYKPKAKHPPQWANSERADIESNQGITNYQLPITNYQLSIINYQLSIVKAAAVALAVIALSGAIIWALAFTNGVYGSEHTWVTFARWVYANVPDGSCIAYEHWDDRMPTNIPEPGGNPESHHYRQPQLPMYDDDTQQKYENLRDTLLNCDYVVLATNRLWRAIPRLPERYPMSTRYYEALFSGALGFEQLYAAETPPRLGPFVFDDQPADESFTVYDHPKPILFKKTRRLSADEWDALLGNSWQAAIPGYVGPTTLLMRLRGASNNLAESQTPPPPTEGEKSLMLARPVDQLTVANDYRWNALANNSPLAATLLWWLLMVGVGLIFLPFTFLLFNNLPDRGYALGKSLGLLLVSYVIWITGSLTGFSWLGNTLATAIIVSMLFIALSIVLAIINIGPLLQFCRSRAWLILITEGVFSLIYLFFVYLRVLNPDLWHPWLGGEKMLEIGFLNAIVKSVHMPPYDPFFAGGIINYYYYGLFLVGVLIKLTGIQPSIAFNLAIPTLAALTASNAFSLAANLSSSLQNSQLPTQNPKLSTLNSRLSTLIPGLLGILFVVFLGNLEGAAQFMRNLADVSLNDFDSAIPGLATLIPAVSGFFKVLGGDTLAIYNYWDPTRVIPETINEFPFFSFLFADLHPHMIGLPFTLLFLSLVYNRLLPENGQKTNLQDNQTQNPKPETLNPELKTQNPLDCSGQAKLKTQNPKLKTQNPKLIIRWLAIPFTLGAIAVINTWDLPTYLGLIMATFLLGRYRQLASRLTLWHIAGLLTNSALFAAAVLGVTYLLYLPFFANYQPPAETGVGLVHTKTPLDQHLKIWGFFLFIIVSWLWISLLRPNSRNALLRAISLYLRRWNVLPHLSQIYRVVVKHESDAYQLALWGGGLLVVIAAALFMVGYRVPAYLLPLVIVSLLLLLRREGTANNAFLGLLTFTGLMILLGVEFFFLRDFLGGGDYYRMNTLFKFFIQVWVMFGLAAAVMLAQLWEWAWRWSLPAQIAWRGATVILLLAGLIYPILGTRTRVDDRFPGDLNRPPVGTLDGLAYMTVGRFEWPAGNPIELRYDYEAIQWLQDNVTGTPVLAEAKIGYYREGGMRVAAYTGLPSILGGLHQNEQRYASQIGERDWVVNEFWATPDPTRALQLMEELGISYIYIGQIERATYGSQVESKFEQLRNWGELELVFENEATKIYKRD
jgi:YYY domain-containing protein